MKLLLKPIAMLLNRRDKKLGVADGQRYDLPLNKGGGTGFLIMLVALMTFLGAMALTMSFVLGEVTQRWASGLENRMTIEIPAEDAQGNIRETADLRALARDVSDLLTDDTALIASHEVMSEEDIAALLKPWLGDNLILQDIPLPALISAELRADVEDLQAHLTALQERLDELDPNIRKDMHEDWLAELVRFTGSLRFAALMVTLLIAITTIAAVAGAINARIAIHRKEVELLHLMGARDRYINRQFQRHALILCLQGGVYGLVGAFTVMGLIALIAGGENSLLPDLSFSNTQLSILLSLPAIIALIGTITARLTVLRALSKMP